MEQTQVMELTADNFDANVFAAAQPVLVDFWAPWCGPCRAMAPVVEAAAEIFAGHLQVTKVNVDHQPGLAAQHRVSSIPTLKLFRNGVVVRTWTGAQPQAQLVHELAGVVRGAVRHPANIAASR